MGLSGSGLSIGKDRAVVALKYLVNEGAYNALVNIRLEKNKKYSNHLNTTTPKYQILLNTEHFGCPVFKW